jgi:hypothetical protein
MHRTARMLLLAISLIAIGVLTLVAMERRAERLYDHAIQPYPIP